MPARSIGSGTISFGLVSIPIRVYVATHSEQLSFNLLHAPCGTRIKQQLYCPHHDKVVERSEIVKGYQFEDRKSTRLNSSHSQISYAVFCLKKKKKQKRH